MILAALFLCFIVKVAAVVPRPVTLDNYATVEFDQQAKRMLEAAGGQTNVFVPYREPTPFDKQTVIRMNRDTLYSFGVFDVSHGVTITMPETTGRYVSLMAVNRKGYTSLVFVGPGTHTITKATAGTDFVILVVRILVDASDKTDIREVNVLQDEIKVTSGSARMFPYIEYDKASYNEVYNAFSTLGPFLKDTTDAFGLEGEVDPLKFLIVTTIGWGGLPPDQAFYVNVNPDLPVGEYKMEVPAKVPVDAFWSITIYNAQGYLEEADFGSSSVNSVAAAANSDGTTTLHFGACQDGRINCLSIMEGWNYIVRMYQPRSEVVKKEWTFPGVVPITTGSTQTPRQPSGDRPRRTQAIYCDPTANQFCKLGKGVLPCRTPFVKCLTPSKCLCPK